MKTAFRYGITIGSLGALLLGTVALAPARADDYTALEGAVRRDITAIHHDQSRLQGLYHKLHDQQFHRDFRNAYGTQQRILYVRNDLRKDREMLRVDQRALSRAQPH